VRGDFTHEATTRSPFQWLDAHSGPIWLAAATAFAVVGVAYGLQHRWTGNLLRNNGDAEAARRFRRGGATGWV
jgi:hypothetical protein